MQIKIFLIVFTLVTLVFMLSTNIINENPASAQTFLSTSKEKKPQSVVEQKRIAKSNTVVVYPIFTQAAYSNDGFYDYYKKQCDLRCLSVTIPLKPFGSYVSSGYAFLIITSSLNFDIATDVDVDKNPGMLRQYKRVIILHNEYVTKSEFDAITSHPNVLYLYPNALYAEVKANYTSNKVVLVRGHSYPTPDILNGFGWKFDNSKYEYDTKCKNWILYKINNGRMLNCYPEVKIAEDESFVRTVIGQFDRYQ
jgi:hypothetical protein